MRKLGAMRDAIRMSMDYLKENGKRDKKVLVVVTDGDDNNSSVCLETLSKNIQQSEIPVHRCNICHPGPSRGALTRAKSGEAMRMMREAKID